MLMERGLLLDDGDGDENGTDDDENDDASTSSGAGGRGSRAPSLHFAADLADDGALPGEEGFGLADAEERWRGERGNEEEEEEEEAKEEEQSQPQPQPQQQRKQVLSPRRLHQASSRLSQLAKPKQPWRKASATETAEEKEQREAAAEEAAAAALHQRRRRQRQQRQQQPFFSFLSSAPVEERLFASAKRREQRLELLRLRAAEKEVAGCSFAPRLFLSSPSSLPLSSSSSFRNRPPLHERAAALAAAAAARRLAASTAPPPFPFSPQEMSRSSREIAARAAEAEKREPPLPLSPSRHSVPHATPLPPPFAPRINRISECLVAGTTFEERRERAARARAERLAAAAERAAAAVLGTAGKKGGGRFFPAGAAAILRRKKHGQIGAVIGKEEGGGGGEGEEREQGAKGKSSSALLRASAAAAKAAEAAAEAQAAARPFPLHSPALCLRSLVLAERAREKKKKEEMGGKKGGRRFENVAPGAAGAEVAAAEAAVASAEAEREDWSPAAVAGGRDSKSKARDPDAAILLAARARRASRAAEAAARALAAVAALERECSFRPRAAATAEWTGTTRKSTAATSSFYHPPCAGRPLLASEVVPGCALHLERAARAREAAEEERKRAEVVFYERPRARYVCTKPELFRFSSRARGDIGEGGRHAKAVEEEEAKCPFRPETRAAEDARLVRELLAS